MAAPHTDWTVERLHALPDDGNRYEIVNGALLVTPAPSWVHQDVVVALAGRLREYLAVTGAGRVLVAPADLEVRRDTVVQPDLFVVAHVQGRRARNSQSAGTPLLVVEVVSPSTARADRGEKRALYQTCGVGEYWIADPDAQLFERWRPDDVRPEIAADRIVWSPAGAAVPLTIDLAELWGEAFGE